MLSTESGAALAVAVVALGSAVCAQQSVVDPESFVQAALDDGGELLLR